MSLINEALKRTRDAAGNAGAPSPVTTSYRIESKVETGGSKGSLVITILVAAVALAGVVVLGSHIAKRVQNVKDGFGSNTEAPAAETRPAKPATEPAPPPEVLPKAEVASPPTPAVVTGAMTPATDPKVAEDQIVAKLMERIKAEQAAAPKPSPADPPKLVLQGITYARDGSEALINNLTVREGDDIEGARVTTIESRRVKLDFNGHEISLRLP